MTPRAAAPKPWRLGDETKWYNLYKGNRLIAEFDGAVLREEMDSIIASLNRDYAEDK